MYKNSGISCSENKKGMYSKINIILMFFFTIFSVTMPNDSFNIKKLSFILLFVLNFNLIFKNTLKKEFNIIGFHIFVFSSILAIFSLLIGGNVYATIANIYICLYAGIVIVIVKRKINFEKILLFTLIFISILMVGSVILDASNILDIYDNNLMMFLHNNSEAMVGKSPIFWSYYIVFMKASPLILILLGYALFKERYLLATLAFAALTLSGTRANLFAALILLAIYIFLIQKKMFWKITTIIVLIVILVISFEYMNNYFSYMFTSKAESGINKSEDIKEILTVFKQHPVTIFLGTGFGSEGKFGIVNGTSEVSLFDMWRKNGLLGLTMFLYFVLKPLKRLWKRKETRWLSYSYITYLMVAMTNPLFFSSTAYIMYIYVYTMYYFPGNKLNTSKVLNVLT